MGNEVSRAISRSHCQAITVKNAGQGSAGHG